MFIKYSKKKGQEEAQLPQHVETTKPMNPHLWKLMICLGVLIYGTYSIFVHLCEVDGKLPFSSASAVLLTEVTKLILSICMFMPEVRENGFHLPTLKFVIPFAVPAILYWINNNLGIHLQLQMDPATYQVLSNFKILSTAILYRLIIKRPISTLQWVSLAILVSAGICNSVGGIANAKVSGKSGSAGQIHITLLGIVMISCYCTISGLSGVYSEYILKKHYQTSLHFQNILLYIFGVLLNGSTFLTSAVSSNDPSSSLNLFKGFSVYVWSLIFSQAIIGLIMSAVMKHASNIARLFLIGCAMLVTTVLSMIIFGLQLNIYFCASFVLVIVSLGLYHY